MPLVYSRTATITGPSLDWTSGSALDLNGRVVRQGDHGGIAQAPPARAGPTPLYSRTATITGPSLVRTGGEHNGIAQAPPACARLGPLYSPTATITGQSLHRTGGDHGGTGQEPPARAGMTPIFGRPPLPDRHLNGRMVSTAG